MSEKRAALEVLEKRLSTHQLDHFCHVATSDRMGHAFVQSLKDTWDFLENYPERPVHLLQLSEQYRDHLQYTLDLLKQQDLIGGVSFSEFQRLSSGKKLLTDFDSAMPSIREVEQHISLITEVFDRSLQLSIGYLQHSALEKDRLLRLDQATHQALQRLERLNGLFAISSYEDLQSAMKTAADYQVFENELYRKYHRLFKPNSRQQQSFKRLRKKYLALTTTTNTSASEWKQCPSFPEATSLQKQLAEGSFFGKRRAQRRWKQLSHLPVSEAQLSLSQLLDQYTHTAELNKVRSRLHDLGIEDPERELPQIHATLAHYSDEQWRAFATVTPEDRARYTESHSELSQLYQWLKHTFKLDFSTQLEGFLVQFQRQLPTIITLRTALSSLSPLLQSSLRNYKTFDQYYQVLLSSHWVKFQERFPAFSTFSMDQLHAKTTAILTAEDEEFKLFSQSLIQSIQQRFKEYHVLLTTPAHKLSAEQKQLKVRLRKGKSILVKEFNKTRQHPSLRELYSSEACEWIQLLKPIWLSNPHQLANCFPIDADLFEVAILDEASQLSLVNALGTLQRSRRVIVAGDEHQMGPGSYFKRSTDTPVSLLHQANYHLKCLQLTHHYRSLHPQLIAFSNTHFYAGKLTAYPAPHPTIPITRHFDGTNVYENGKNPSEAQRVASYIEAHIQAKGHLGIVAFSEEQLSTIWQALPPEVQHQLTDRMASNTAFFKALENVQGDECDHLIISFGYGKTVDGQFNMRFGPMNAANGRNRLNVLVTRARKSIDFFCSIQASDFKPTDNESVRLLQQWISFCERPLTNDSLEIPYGLCSKIENNILSLEGVETHLSSAVELATFQRIMESRGWELRYS